MTLCALPDEGLLCWLRNRRKGRRNNYPPEVLWRCLIGKFVRFLKRLSSDQGLEHLDEMFQALVGKLSEAIPGLGKHLAVDATAVHA